MKRGLKDFERFISLKANHYAYEKSDVEDFQQEGRIAAWQALERDPNATKSYVQRAVEWKMIDYARKIYAHRESGYTPGMQNLLFGDYGDEDNV